ncbi:amino acid ABC transporter permease [Pseudalkalibacillus berkeleyi]|uniref:Amino acid ABC transporter permease n=1 Tax=Pseudalkalibacillus berkeleyi TaxID=1069813 RepID=A0ABS9GX24_9BACL|nr:amino acid ABC transporter permease [Pseudalkalibacillus berkeleyi]MCF6136145.1 amino acid ABC transporter permease [Pseudalkalibacillus berkeleyi]
MNNDVINLLVNSLPLLLEGAQITIFLSVVSIFGALFIGLIIAVMRISNIKILSWLARFYVSFFRGTPLLTQLLLIYFGLTWLYAFTGIQAAIIGLILHFSAYISESYRASIQSISKGQWEAGYSLGMSTARVFKEVIMPQAWRRSIPPVWNSLIDIVKASSLASVLAVEELTGLADQIAASNLDVFWIFVEVLFIYWGLTTLLSLLQTYLEKKLDVNLQA